MYVRTAAPHHYKLRIPAGVPEEGKEWIRASAPKEVIALGTSMLSVELSVRHEMLSMRRGEVGEYLLETESPDGLVLVFRGVLENRVEAA